MVLAAAIGSTASAQPDAISIGTFSNTGGGQISYVGQFAPFITSGLPDGSHTLITIDLSGILLSQNISTFYGVRIYDTGLNAYGASSPGADVDYLAQSGIDPGVEMIYDYFGPNLVHQNESSATLGTRIGTINSVSGSSDTNSLRFVSLGLNGMLEAAFLNGAGVSIQPPLSGEGPAGAGGVSLLLSEAGVSESFRVDIITTPSPGAGALLALAGLIGRRRART
jgi:hypothetical protein